MIKCKYYGKEELSKFWKCKGFQRYKCKSCNKVFTDKEDTRYKMDKYDLNKRKLAITMCINNVGIGSIERILCVPNELILNWIKNIGKNLEQIVDNNKKQIKTAKKIEVLEMDEIWSYVKKNKIKSKYGLLLIEMETGEIKTQMLNLI